ncbi:MAG: tetratricopeptide repeat protein [Acidobacteria bacterium]|nr:tetratricopeptide repeat protein [Acidobacteriota bacterium]
MRFLISISLFLLLALPVVPAVLPQDVFERAEECYRAGKTAEAEALYSRVASSHANFRQTLVRLGTIYYATGRAALAEERFRQALRIQETADILALLAGSQFNQKKFDDAHKSATRALSLNPRHVKAYTALGMIYTALKSWPDADAAYREALRLEPKDSSTWYLQGRSYYLRNEFVKAREAFETALKLSPESLRVYENLALTLDLLGDWSAAQKVFEAGVRENRNRERGEARIHIAYGTFLFKLHRLEESRGQLEEAVRLEPENPEAYYELSKTLFGLRRLGDAANAAETALRVGEADYRVHFLLSRIYTALGDKAAASRHAELAATLADPAPASGRKQPPTN